MKRDPAGGPVGREDLADQVLPRDEPPAARIAGRGPIVAHHQVVVRWDPGVLPAWWNVLQRQRLGVAAPQLHVGLVPPLAFDVDKPALLPPNVGGQTDPPLHERPFRAALL